MNKRVGILGLLCAAAVGFFHPATASAQDRDDYRRGGYARSYQDEGRGFRGDDRYDRNQAWREARECEIQRQRAWRERARWERRHDRDYGYGYRYFEPAVRFGFRWDSR